MIGLRSIVLPGLAALLSACASAPSGPVQTERPVVMRGGKEVPAASSARARPAAPEASGSARGPGSGAGPSPGRGGAYYLDDGPPDHIPPGLDSIADAVPRVEPLHRFANRPYVVFGRRYVPTPEITEHRERGMASWYGRRYHGRPTSSGEIYDMFAMTAAHPTLPIPSYVRVTNLRNGRSAVVRVNDRGPFLNNRVIDLSFAAAHRLDFVRAGSTEVQVEWLSPASLMAESAAMLGSSDSAD